MLYDCSSYVITCSIRSPSCMAISWSYVCSEFWLLWKVITPPFFFSFCIFLSFTSFFFLLKRLNWWNFIHSDPPVIRLVICLVICPVIRPIIHPVIRSVIHLVIRLVIWCFPIWLTSSLSYPMAIFSENEIQTFLLQFIRNHKIKTLHSYMKTLYFYSVSET